MAQTGYTPIQLYYSSTTTNQPLAANLAGGELAINITDGKLFYKDNANAVQVIGWKTTPTSAGGTGLTSYTAGDTLYYATGTTLTKLAIGTAYQAFQVNAGATAPSWQPSATSVLSAQGDLLYASSANTLARLAKDANATRYLSNTGSSNNPAWAQINLANGVTGTLPTTNGGTNLTSFTSGGVVYASSTSALATGTALVFDGTNLGAGTTSPAAKFDAFQSSVGTYFLGGGGDNKARQLAITSSTTTNSGDTHTFNAQSGTGVLAFATGGTERARINDAGIVTMSAYGVGTATFSAAGVISSVSDETWKIKDGVPVDPDSMLKKLEPGYWYYNDERKQTFGTDRQLGFYAQNVNAAIGPEAAPTPEEGKPWGYYDRSVLAVTVMSLQKALATIELLTARLDAFETNKPV